MVGRFCYFPILKTSQAELRAYENLTDSVKDNILPVFELTKSRISKNNPNGDVHKQIDKLKSLLNGRPCILELISDPTYSNSQIHDFVEENANGYEKWCNFLTSIELPKIIPTLQFSSSYSPENDKAQIEFFDRNFDSYMLRINGRDDEIKSAYDEIMSFVPNKDKLILLIDYGFISNEINYTEYISSSIEIIESLDLPKNVVICGSSYPQFVGKGGYGDDRTGTIPLLEKRIFNELDHRLDYPFKYGDYSSVHPIRYNTVTRGWIARVDYPIDDSIFYYRVRGKDYNYTYGEAARLVVQDTRYDKLGSWGVEEIECAAHDSPNGRSPSFWIAVRINIHITRQAALKIEIF